MDSYDCSIIKKNIPFNRGLFRSCEKLLKDNYYLSEVTYRLTKEGNILVHAETHVGTLSFKTLKPSSIV